MIDTISWQEDELCDVCFWPNLSQKARQLTDVMLPNGNWNGGFSQEKGTQWQQALATVDKEGRKLCLVFVADMERVVICAECLGKVSNSNNGNSKVVYDSGQVDL